MNTPFVSVNYKVSEDLRGVISCSDKDLVSVLSDFVSEKVSVPFPTGDELSRWRDENSLFKQTFEILKVIET